MKTNLKRVLIAILTITMLVVFIPHSVEAYGYEGSLYNPVKLGTKGKYTIHWYDDDFYATFKMNKNGYATINASKPFNSRGSVTYYNMYIYDKYGNLVWDCYSKGQQNTPTLNYNYRVGLKKGTYTLRLDPSLSVPRNSSITSTLSVKTTANKYWEIENNDSFQEATTIKTNKKYYAFYGENTFDKSDYFKIKLTKGKVYHIVIGNYRNMFFGSTLCDVITPNGYYMDSYGWRFRAGYNLKYYGQVYIKPSKTGYHYIRIHNSFGYKNPGSQYTITVKPYK